MPGYTDGRPLATNPTSWWEQPNIAVVQLGLDQGPQAYEAGEGVIWTEYQNTIHGRSADIPVDSRLAEDHPARDALKEIGVLGEPVVAIGIGDESFVVVDVSDTPIHYDDKYRAPFTNLSRLKPGSPPLFDERNDGEPILALLHFEPGGVIAVRRLEQGKDKEAVFDRTPEAQERMKRGGANFFYAKDSGVSRYQGGITLAGDTITISDLRSTNGTLVETVIPSQKQERKRGQELSGDAVEIVSYANTMGAKVLELSRKEKLEPHDRGFTADLASATSRDIMYLLGEQGVQLPVDSFDPDNSSNLNRFATDAHAILQDTLGRGSYVDTEYRRRFSDSRTPTEDDIAWLTSYMAGEVTEFHRDSKSYLQMRVEDYTMAALSLLANLARENSSRVRITQYMNGNMQWTKQHYEQIWGVPEPN